MAKIMIMADSVAEAKTDLEMIEKAISIGAIAGSGSSVDGTMNLAMPTVEDIEEEDCCPCGCDEVFSSDYYDKPDEIDGGMLSRIIAEAMGL